MGRLRSPGPKRVWGLVGKIQTTATAFALVFLVACTATPPEPAEGGPEGENPARTTQIDTSSSAADTSGGALVTSAQDGEPPGEESPTAAREPADPVLAELQALGRRLDSLVLAQGATAASPEESTDSTGEEASEPAAPPGNLWRAFWTVVVMVGAFITIRFIAFVLEALAERNAERRLLYKRFVPLARLFFWVVAALVIARGIWSIDAQGLLAAGAAGAVAIGFAAQDILKNVFGGLVIVADRPFAAGDKIRVGDTYGEVVSVGLWSTRITTPDDNLVSVPNSQIVNGQVANANSGALDCQVVTDLYLPGWVDERLAKKIAYESAASSPFVYLHKPIVVLVRDHFQDTFVTNLKVKAYVLDQRYEFRFMSDVTERARREFRKHGLLGPFHGARPFFRVDRETHADGPNPQTVDTTQGVGNIG